MNPQVAEIEQYFRALLPQMIGFATELIEVESYTRDVASLDRCAYKLSDYVFSRVGIRPRIITTDLDARTHLQVDLGQRPDVVLVGHFDTVHPLGTLQRNPAHYADGRLYGPGALDMKGGVVMMVEIARKLQQRIKNPNVSLFFNSDEELGSFSSTLPLQELAQQSKGAIIFDFGDPTRALRTAARGVMHANIHIEGRGGHAAYPERVLNPIDQVAKILNSLDKVRDTANGLSVTPTMLQGSQRTNVVSDVASIGIDIRARYDHQFDEVEKFFQSFADHDYSVEIETVIRRAAFPENPNNAMFEAAQVAAANLGWDPLRAMEARGASDANTIAVVCDSVIDGFGGWGEGAHSDKREFLDVESLVHFSTLGAATTETMLNQVAAAEREAS